MIIAIDGPAASGKSSVAARVAEALGARFLDTGAMYRAVTLRAQAAGLDPTDEATCGALAEGLDLTFDDQGRILIDGVAGEPHIRSAAVTAGVSAVSALARVRRAMVARQRALGTEQDLVVEGRDTTTVVFPQAEHKIFLVAGPAERGRRRAEQEGRPERATQYAAELAERDAKDEGRENSPLRRADDALLIETDGMTVDEVVARILARVRA
jgi:CMP/dCMP kinase